jgi:hypothetical protein
MKMILESSSSGEGRHKESKLLVTLDKLILALLPSSLPCAFEQEKAVTYSCFLFPPSLFIIGLFTFPV